MSWISDSGTSLVMPVVGLYSTGVILNAFSTPALSFLEEVRKLKPKNLCFLPGAGRSGVGDGCVDCVKLGEASVREGTTGRPSTKLLSTYFFLTKRSMAESISSASRGMSGCLFLGLNSLFEAIFPRRFMLCAELAFTHSDH